MKRTGNLIIQTKADADKYAAVTEITGNLYISADASLPVLTSVGGDLSLSILADAPLPALTSVGGNLYISADAPLPALTSVGGDLSILADAPLPALTSVGGNLYISADASLPVLTSVGGHLDISADAPLPALTSVGGDLSILADASLPVLTSVGGYLSIDAKLEAHNLYAKGFANFRVYDGIACAIISKKAKDGVEILNCRRAQVRDGKIVGDRFIIAKRGEDTAHGKTIKEALEELAFKTGARDVEKYRNMPLTTRKSPKAWAIIYRQVTGACQWGTQDFMARRTLKKSYTLAEILSETQGAFGHEAFRGVVSP